MGNLKTESSAKKFIPTILFVKNEGPFFGGKIADEWNFMKFHLESFTQDALHQREMKLGWHKANCWVPQ